MSTSGKSRNDKKMNQATVGSLASGIRKDSQIISIGNDSGTTIPIVQWENETGNTMKVEPASSVRVDNGNNFKLENSHLFKGECDNPNPLIHLTLMPGTTGSATPIELSLTRCNADSTGPEGTKGNNKLKFSVLLNETQDPVELVKVEPQDSEIKSPPLEDEAASRIMSIAEKDTETKSGVLQLPIFGKTISTVDKSYKSSVDAHIDSNDLDPGEGDSVMYDSRRTEPTEYQGDGCSVSGISVDYSSRKLEHLNNVDLRLYRHASTDDESYMQCEMPGTTKAEANKIKNDNMSAYQAPRAQNLKDREIQNTPSVSLISDSSMADIMWDQGATTKICGTQKTQQFALKSKYQPLSAEETSLPFVFLSNNLSPSHFHMHSPMSVMSPEQPQFKEPTIAPSTTFDPSRFGYKEKTIQKEIRDVADTDKKNSELPIFEPSKFGFINNEHISNILKPTGVQEVRQPAYRRTTNFCDLIPKDPLNSENLKNSPSYEITMSLDPQNIDMRKKDALSTSVIDEETITDGQIPIFHPVDRVEKRASIGARFKNFWKREKK